MEKCTAVRTNRRWMLLMFAVLGVVSTAVNAEIRFTDVSAAAGLVSDDYYSESGHSLGVVWLDVNGDELPDFFVSNGYDTSGPHLYLNLGDGTFELRDRLLPELANLEYVGARTADYDGDGDADLFVYTAHEEWDIDGFDTPADGPPNLLLKNLWAENGEEYSEPMFVDVAEAAGVDDCPNVPLGEDYGCFQSRTAAFLDYDLDGCVDLFVGHLQMNHARRPENRNALYRNRCDGTFENATNASMIDSDPQKWRPTLIVSAADFDADGCPDLYVGNVNNHVSLPEEDFNDVILVNNCDGTFREVAENQGNDTPAAMGIDIADLNFDGNFEIYITDVLDHLVIEHDPGNTLYLLEPDDAISENLAAAAGVVGDSSWGTNFFDVDLDGDEDLFVGVATMFANSILYENRFSQGFLEHRDDVGLSTSQVRGSALADYDRDGDLDILLVSQDGPVQLYRNDSDREGSSLRIRLRSTLSNPDAFGAIVKVKVGDRIYRRQLKGGSSAHSQDFGELFFGLPGDAPDRIEVQWPSGATSIYTDVVGATLDIVEPLDGE